MQEFENLSVELRLQKHAPSCLLRGTEVISGILSNPLDYLHAYIDFLIAFCNSSKELYGKLTLTLKP